MAWDAQNARYHFLRLSRVLCRGIDDDTAGFIKARDGALRFEVEMLLPADGKPAADSMRTARYGVRRIGAADPVRARVETPGRDGVFDRQYGRERAVLHIHSRSPQAGGFERLAEHPRDRLRVISDFRGKQQLVVTIGAGVALAWNIRG